MSHHDRSSYEIEDQDRRNSVTAKPYVNKFDNGDAGGVINSLSAHMSAEEVKATREQQETYQKHIKELEKKAEDKLREIYRKTQDTKHDIIANPKHYTRGKYECWDVMQDLGIDKCFYLGAAFKYLWRCGHKDNIIQDLEKAVAYLNRKIVLLKSESAIQQEASDKAFNEGMARESSRNLSKMFGAKNSQEWEDRHLFDHT